MRAAVMVLLLAWSGACASGGTCGACVWPSVADEGAVAAPAPPRVPEELDMGALENELAALRRGGKSRVRYVAASNEEWGIYGDWVRQCARAASGLLAEPPPPPRGFSRRVLSRGALWLLSEQPQQRRGAGAVVLRVGPARDLLIEAPHTFFDRDTLPLSLAFFELSGARVLLLNTAHRANVAGDLGDAARDQLARSGQLSSDVAHADNAFFTSAHAALVRQLPHAVGVQLHGFRDGKAAFDLIVSGSNSVFDAAPLSRALGELLSGYQVALYPRDTRQLGGERNAQAKVSRRYAAPFVHLELSSRLREALMAQAETRQAFFAVLQAAVLPAQPPGGR